MALNKNNNNKKYKEKSSLPFINCLLKDRFVSFS